MKARPCASPQTSHAPLVTLSATAASPITATLPVTTAATGLAIALVALSVLGLAPPSMGESPSSPRGNAAGGAETLFELEEPDDPPGKPARGTPFARTAAPLAALGPYFSIQVNVDSLGRNILGDAANEPSIAVNPTNPANMVIGWRQFDTISSNFRQAGWAYTFNGGLTWTFPGVLEPGVFRSDPVLDADSHGTFYYQSLRSSFLVDVFRSTDGGVTWLAPVTEYGGDKNWLAVDRSGGPSDGYLYGIWQRFASCCGSNIFTRSTDGGASFEPPASVPFSPIFGTLAVGPDGEVWATGIDGKNGQDFNHFVAMKSTSAGHPPAPIGFTGGRVNLGGSMQLGAGPNPGGLLGQANVAVDRSPAPTRGNVYTVASVLPFFSDIDPLDVNFISSSNGGASWSPPIRVNDDGVSTGNWHWFAAHSIAPNGRIDVIWNDTRNSGQENVSQLFYAYSWDAGATWSPNVPVSPPFDSSLGYPNQSKMGDYDTLISDQTGADVAYTATFNGEQDIFYLRVFPDCNGNGISDVTDLATRSSLDCDANHVPDECEAAPTCLGAGGVPDGGSVPGTPVRVAKAGGGDLLLSWGASCASAGDDYAIYEGAMGDFTSHTSRLCSTGGQRTWTISPAAGGTYYLVVSIRADREGSYGRASSGQERPTGHAECVPQQIASCP